MLAVFIVCWGASAVAAWGETPAGRRFWREDWPLVKTAFVIGVPVALLMPSDGDALPLVAGGVLS